MFNLRLKRMRLGFADYEYGRVLREGSSGYRWLAVRLENVVGGDSDGAHVLAEFAQKQMHLSVHCPRSGMPCPV